MSPVGIETRLSVILSQSGRVTSVRFSGAKLAFVDIERDSQVTQITCNLSYLQQHEQKQESVEDKLKAFRRVVRRGDWICMNIVLRDCFEV